MFMFVHAEGGAAAGVRASIKQKGGNVNAGPSAKKTAPAVKPLNRTQTKP